MSTITGIEVKKDGLRQCQDGTWKLSLTVHPNDMPTSLMSAAMGTRYMAALVEIGDDEQPVETKPLTDEQKATAREAIDNMKPKGGRRAREAGIACGDPQFARWLWDRTYCDGTISCSADAATRLRKHLGVASRADLDHNEPAGQRWDALYAQYLEETGRMAERR